MPAGTLAVRLPLLSAEDVAATPTAPVVDTTTLEVAFTARGVAVTLQAVAAAPTDSP